MSTGGTSVNATLAFLSRKFGKFAPKVVVLSGLLPSQPSPPFRKMSARLPSGSAREPSASARAPTGLTVYAPGEAEWPLCVATSRGIKKVPHALLFSTAHRPTAQPVGSAATVPFHYAPPPLLDRDPTTMAKNAPKVCFAMATREQLARAASTAAATPRAGPGAYDVVRGLKSLSTSHKTISDGSFFRATREAGNDRVMAASAVGPGEYETSRSLDYTKPRAGSIPFTTAPRDVTAANAGFPGPDIVRHIDKHTPRAAFPTGPGHVMAPADPVTAAVPIRDTQRLPKHKPKFRFSTAPRW